MSDIFARLKRQLSFQARLRLIQLAAGDYARKYLPLEPLLATRKDKRGAYDPKVEAEVQAALAHKHPLTGKKERQQHDRYLRKSVRQEGSGIRYKEVEGGEIAILEPTKKPFRSFTQIQSGIARQQTEITSPKKAPEPPPPEMLSSHPTGKTPARGSDYEGGGDIGDLWDTTKAKSPGVKVKEADVTRTIRRKWTPEKVRENALKYRDPIAYHQARVAAGATENKIRIDKISKQPVLPSLAPLGERSVETQERVNAQAIRDAIAAKLRGVRRDVIKPMRAERRKALGLPSVKPRKGWKTFYKDSDEAARATGNIEIARGSKFQKPAIRPGIPMVDREVHPMVIAQAHQQYEGDIAATVGHHKARAAAARQEVHDLVHAHFSKSTHGQKLHDLVDSTMGRIFTIEHGPLTESTKMIPHMKIHEADALANITGQPADWIKKKHGEFLHHAFLGETEAGEAHIRSGKAGPIVKSLPPAPAFVPPVKSDYSTLKKVGKIGGIGAGVAVAGGGAYALYRHRQNQKQKLQQFSVFDKIRDRTPGQEDTTGHDIAIGAIEGGAGVLATDRLIHRWGKTLPRKLGIGIGVGGLATGTIGVGVNLLTRHRKKQREKQMAAKGKTIRFAEPTTDKRRLPSRTLVARDRYIKDIHQRDVDRAGRYYTRAALAGGAVGALARKTMPLPTAILAGAGVGAAAQGGTRLLTRTTKDQFGDRSWTGKRIDKTPWVAGAAVAAGLGGRKAWKYLKHLSARDRLIRFAQKLDYDVGQDQDPWVATQLTRAIRHPKSRAEALLKWGSRGKRIARDLGATRTKGGKIIDERGRERTPEWKKDWVKRGIGIGIVSAGLIGAGKGLYSIRKKGAIAVGALEKGASVEELTPGSRLAANVVSGNWHRSLQKRISDKLPNLGLGQKFGKLRSEVKQAKDELLHKTNEAIEGDVGTITGGRLNRDSSGYIKKKGGIQIDNPAYVEEHKAKLQAEKEKLSRGLKRVAQQEKEVNAPTSARSAVEEVLKKVNPQKQIVGPFHGLIKTSSRFKPIYFDDPVYVRPHVRRSRRYKDPREKKDVREAFLVGSGGSAALFGTAYGAKYGFNRSANREARAAKFTADVDAGIAKEAERILALRKTKNVVADLVKFKK